MSRVLGVDWGTVRVGVAMSDEEQKLSFPLQHPLESRTAIEEIQKMVEEYDVGKIVIGLPLSLQGQETESTQRTRKFAENVRKKTGLDPEFVDERFSSVASTQALRQQEVKEKDQRQIKDNIAAALMLQKYLETNNK
jgi:putative holliday junction resolvase